MSTQQQNAVRGAHIGGGVQSATNLPSIFDYLAQESLWSSMKPGIRSALKLLLHYFPRRLTIVEAYFEELYLLFQLFLENHYLKRFSASFSENFYGMKRVPLRAGASLSRLGHRFRSLIFIAILPYICDKLEKFREHLQFEADTVQCKGWRRLFLRLFPHLKALFLFLSLFFQISYAFSLTSIPTPLLLLAKCRLERLVPEDISRFDAEGQLPMHMRNKSIFSTIWRFLLSFPSILGRFLSYALFIVQFIEYCYSDELGLRFGQLLGGHQSIRIPEHPYNSLPTEQQVLCMEVDKCPICRRTRINDTVLSVSGYAFCHSCIYNFVRLEGRCPITSIPATSNELIKIYH